MNMVLSPWLLRVAGVLPFGVLMALRAEMDSHWLRALLAGGAFGSLALTVRPVPRR